MADNKTIHFIPPLPLKREKRVGIYCRVSTNSVDQLKSLAAQVSALTRLTAANSKWLLVDVYITFCFFYSHPIPNIQCYFEQKHLNNKQMTPNQLLL